jgi:hypothetical protein
MSEAVHEFSELHWAAAEQLLQFYGGAALAAAAAMARALEAAEQRDAEAMDHWHCVRAALHHGRIIATAQ